MMNNTEYEVDARDVEYQRQAGKPWLARIYQPKGTGPFPSTVDVHGGAWHKGERTE
jgi:acetyl esterase/lipase